MPVSWPGSEEGLPPVTLVQGELPPGGLADRIPLVSRNGPYARVPVRSWFGLHDVGVRKVRAVDGDTATVTVQQSGKGRPARSCRCTPADSRPTSSGRHAGWWVLRVVEAAAGDVVSARPSATTISATGTARLTPGQPSLACVPAYAGLVSDLPLSAEISRR